MKILALTFLLTLTSITLNAKQTTCDILAENADVTLNEDSNPMQIITAFPMDLGGSLTFTEDVISQSPVQTTITINGELIFIDAILYSTAFGTQLMLFEYNGTPMGTYSGFGSTPDLELSNCTVN